MGLKGVVFIYLACLQTAEEHELADLAALRRRLFLSLLATWRVGAVREWEHVGLHE